MYFSEMSACGCVFLWFVLQGSGQKDVRRRVLAERVFVPKKLNVGNRSLVKVVGYLASKCCSTQR